MTSNDFSKTIIHYQSKLSTKRGSFGACGNLSKNGCSVVCAHNVNVVLGKNTSFLQTLIFFNNPFRTFCGGLLGALPHTLIRYFKKNNCRVKVYYNKNKISPTHDAYAAFYLWKSGRKIGAHYTALKRNQNIYIAYNNLSPRNSNASNTDEISDFKHISSQSSTFCILILGIDNITKSE